MMRRRVRSTTIVLWEMRIQRRSAGDMFFKKP